MADFDYSSDPELHDHLETIELLKQGSSDVAMERPSEALWESIAGVAFSAQPVVSAPAGGGSPAGPGSADASRDELGVRREQRQRRRPGLAVLSGGIAAGFVLLVLVPLGFAWRSSQQVPVDSTAQLTQLGDFSGEGSAELSGRSLKIDVEALPEAGDSSYELWLIDLEGGKTRDLASLGKIDSSGKFEVPEGIDPQQYSVVDVSLEPNDGNPEHSGVSVLQGELTSS